jgi:hypothetical protein
MCNLLFIRFLSNIFLPLKKSPYYKRKTGERGRSLFVYLSVCLSDCPHALIGRQPSRDFALFLYVEGCEGGGTTDCRHACEQFFGFSVKPPLLRQRDNACDNSFYIFQRYEFAAVSRHFTLFTFISSLSSLKLNSHGMCVTHILTASNTFGQQRQSSFSLFGMPGGLFCPFPVFRH